VKLSGPRAVGTSKTNEMRLVRSCLLFLTGRGTSSVNSLIPTRKREELNALITFIKFTVEEGDENGISSSDLERALLLLYHRLVRTWNSSENLKDLKALFPKVVGGAPMPSALERYAEKDQGLINTLCVKLTELRFR